MNDDQLTDLKQFITATVSQTEQRLTERMDGIDQKIGNIESRLDSVERKIDVIDKKVDDGFAGMGEAIEGINEHQTDQDNRLTKLESVQPA